MPLFSLFQSADEFHMAEDWEKQDHSQNLSVLLYIAHLLPLASMSEDIPVSTFGPPDFTKGILSQFTAHQTMHTCFLLHIRAAQAPTNLPTESYTA